MCVSQYQCLCVVLGLTAWDIIILLSLSTTWPDFSQSHLFTQVLTFLLNVFCTVSAVEIELKSVLNHCSSAGSGICSAMILRWDEVVKRLQQLYLRHRELVYILCCTPCWRIENDVWRFGIFFCTFMLSERGRGRERRRERERTLLT